MSQNQGDLRLPSKIKDLIKKAWAHEGFKKYFKNTSWMFIGKMFALAISFFVGAYVARYLGPANYGLMNYAISFVDLFGFLASFGVDGIAGREIIEKPEEKDKIIGTSFYIKLFGAILTITAIFIVSLLTTHDTFTLILIWIFALTLIPNTFNIIDVYFQSQVLSKQVVKSQIISNLISTLLKLIVVILNKGIFWLIFIFIIEASLVSLFLMISFVHNGHHFRNWKFDKKIAISLLKDSWPIIFSSLAIGIYMKIDQVMIKNMMNNESAGLYAATVKLSEIWYMIPTIICASIFPAIMNAKKISEVFFNQRIKKLYFLMFWSSFIIALLTSIFAYPIIFILFGESYLKTVPVLQIYIWSGIAVFLGVALGQYILSHNLNKISFYNTILGATINVILNFVLIPRYGITGAAIATMISYSVSTLGILFFKKTRKHGFLMLRSIINI